MIGSGRERKADGQRGAQAVSQSRDLATLGFNVILCFVNELNLIYWKRTFTSLPFRYFISSFLIYDHIQKKV